ncbi:MAG: hypothetical protein GX644_12215 [Limnobacter sp.]|nr:hypothetical protein [Limnobacter sp.]
MNFIGHLDWTGSGPGDLPDRRKAGGVASLPRCTIAAIAAILVAGPAAGADVVYRCTGNVYQSAPCPGGKSIDIDPERNVVEPERRRPEPKPAAEPRERTEVIVVERDAPPAPPVVVREPVYILPHRPQPRLHGPPTAVQRRHPPGERPGSRAPRDVGRPAYGFRP